MALLSCYKQGILEAGCDEAGRGCLSGPVFAAAVILPANYYHNILNDSKKLNEKTRYKLRSEIERDAVAFAVAGVDNDEIDKINILNASILAMHKALNQLKTIPQHILIDGNKFKPFNNIPFQCIIGGDGKYLSIAAASILAKTYRDDFMNELHIRYPQYQWARNKGYATNDHIEAIRLFGYSPYHRRSFHLKNKQLKLNFGKNE